MPPRSGSTAPGATAAGAALAWASGMQGEIGARRRWREVTVIAVVANADGAWRVVQEPAAEPLARFEAKEDALSFALALARSRPNWEIYLRRETSADPGVSVASGQNIRLSEPDAGGAGVSRLLLAGLLLSLALTLAPAAAYADEAPAAGVEAPAQRARADRPALAPEDLEFLAAAAQAGLLQVRAGESAVGRSSKSDVRALAEESVLGHTLANERLKTISLARGVPWPEELDPPHRSALAALESLEGAPFDARYVREAGVVAHEQTVRLFERGAVSADPDIRHFAEATLPLLRSQLRHARRIEDDTLARRVSSR